jgi:hypothetical protein
VPFPSQASNISRLYNFEPCPVPIVQTCIDPAFARNGSWYQSALTTGATTAIVDLSGGTGNLTTQQPLPPSAVHLTTDNTDAATAQVSVNDNFGIASAIIPTIQLAYSYFKTFNADPNSNTFAAPWLGLTFYNPINTQGDPDTLVTLVYEPYWNPGPGLTVPPTGSWQTVQIDGALGLWWQDGGFGKTGSSGGPPLKTLEGWLTDPDGFNSDFDNAALISVTVGVGTYNRLQDDYFDAVKIYIPVSAANSGCASRARTGIVVRCRSSRLQPFPISWATLIMPLFISPANRVHACESCTERFLGLARVL